MNKKINGAGHGGLLVTRFTYPETACSNIGLLSRLRLMHLGNLLAHPCKSLFNYKLTERVC